MFTLGAVSLRPLEPADIETMYPWHLDYELDIYSSWGRRRSRAAYTERYRQLLLEPRDDLVLFGIISNGGRHDMHFFGPLKPAFYQRYTTLFTRPQGEGGD